MLATLAGSGVVRAQEAPPAEEESAEVESSEDVTEARAEVAAPIAARNGLDATSAGTAISIDDRPQSGETLREVLAEAPGARVLSTGALGQFNTITLRGSELGQTTVMLDDLPLGGPDVGPVDLSLLPISAFSSLEVYRGGAPAWISDGSVGGVLRLVPRTTNVSYLRPHADFGSFRTTRAFVDAGVAEGSLRLASSFGITTSRQDFPFRNENGTLFDPSDDFDDRQRNARITQRHAFADARIRIGRGELHAVYLGIGRDGGYPGAGLRRTLYASQTITQNTAAVAWSSTHPIDDARNVRLQVRYGVNAQRNEFVDPYGGVGLGASDTDDRTRVHSLRVATRVDATSWLEATAILAGRFDTIDRTDHAAALDDAPAHRLVGGGTFEARVHAQFGRTRFEIRPSYQVQRNHVRVSYPGDFGATEHVSIDRTLQTARIGVVVSPLDSLAIQASAYRGVRAPSILELFGNRATVVSNPALLPESGLGGDVGAIVRLSSERYCLLGEARAFAQTLDDIIVLVPTNQYQARAKNLPRATVIGLETSARLSWGSFFDVVAQWNVTRAHDAAGYQLTNRPFANGYVRTTGGIGPRGDVLSDARLYVDVTYVSRTYLAPSELKVSPARTFLGLGVEISLFEGSLLGSFSVRDALNVGGTDFLGYPLSGRSFSGSVSYRKEFE